jgi:hypothetical protein
VSLAQIKNSFSSIGELDASISPSALVLKLSVTQEALRYFVLSKIHQTVIFFGDYTLHHVATPAALAAAIEKIYEKDEILQLHYAKVLIGFDENYFLIPHEFSNLSIKSDQLATQCSDTDIAFDISPEVGLILKKLFSNPAFLHLNSSYLQLLPDNAREGHRLFVNVNQKYFDSIYFDNSGLQFMNRYEYRTASDFIYFVLLCCDQLNIDRKTTELVLIGEVDIQSKIYDICFRYFRVIRFIQKPDNLHFSRVFEIYPKHLHFSLYNLGS